jgi:hypothetical protein
MAIYSVLRSPGANYDMKYCVGLNGEPMTNPTHSVLAAEQAKKICETYSLQGQYSINSAIQDRLREKGKSRRREAQQRKTRRSVRGENT